MGIKKKLAFMYFIMTIILFLLVSSYVVIYNNKKIRKDAHSALSNYSESVRQQYELQLSKYDQAATNLLSDPDFVNDIRTLSYIERIPNNDEYLEKAYRSIDNKITNYSNLTDFHRVNIITTSNDFVTNDIYLSSANQSSYQKLAALLKNSEINKKQYIIPKFRDIWSTDDQYLFSYVREVSYSNGAKVFVEIEDTQDNVDQLFSNNLGAGMSIFVIGKEAKVISYSDGGDLSRLHNYLKYNRDADPIVYDGYLVNRLELMNGQEIIAFQELAIVNSTMWNTSFFIIVVSLIVLFAMYHIFKQLLNRILEPLETLKTEMELLSIETLPENSVSYSTDNEIVSLTESYNGLKKRINASLENELIAQRKQFDANMEVLQAQIDPHFIYNIMNIVAYKGIEHNDRDTIEIAHGISQMLRYSTSNVEKYATFKEEFAHVESYLLLMKKRYQDMLNYQIDLDERFYDSVIPKLVLQIFVENSIKYTFYSGKDQLRIMILVDSSDEHQWQIKIQDNGPGMDDEVLETIVERINEIRNTFENNQSLSKLEFEIGGLGIINTYARLRLFFGADFDMRIKSSVEGTEIRLWKR